MSHAGVGMRLPEEDDMDSYKYSVLESRHLLDRDHSMTKSWNPDTCIVGHNISKQDTHRLDNFVSTLRTIIPSPEGFLKEFRNPCWYMQLSISQKITRLLLLKGTSLTEAEASSIMSEIFQQQDRQGKKVEKKTLVCIPKVFFIGFPRSGSTQLFKMLVKHPKVIPGFNKEPHWWTRFPFTAKFPLNAVAIIRYLVHFREASQQIADDSNSLTIDGSQSTIWDTRYTHNLCLLPSLISSILPMAKYIVIMREPIDRLYSDFTYLCEVYWEDNDVKTIPNSFLKTAPEVFHKAAAAEIRDFKACLENSSVDICTHYASSGSAIADSSCGRVRLGISLYYVHISRWLKTIPKESFHFVRMENMAADPYAILQSTWRFLNVPSQTADQLQDILHEHKNSNYISQMKSMTMKLKTRAMLQEFFQPYNERLAEVLDNRAFLWEDV